MTGKPLPELIDDRIGSGLLSLPVCPDVAERVRSAVRRAAPEPAVLALLADRDPALACHLFRAANSAFYQGLPKVLTSTEAITRLGTTRTAELFEHACAADGNRPARSPLAGYLEPLWQHCLGCALGARWLAIRCGYPALADRVHLAGLLHDIGKLLLLAALEPVAGDRQTAALLGSRLIEEILQSMHVAAGLRLAAEWHLPAPCADVIGRHHDAAGGRQEPTLALVMLANQACCKLGLGGAGEPGLLLPATAEAQFLGIGEIALAECEIMLEDHFRPPSASGNQTLTNPAGSLPLKGSPLLIRGGTP